MKHQKQRFPQQISWKVVGFAILTAAAVSGCMTTSRGVNQTVEINSYPYEARVYIDGELAGTTPLSAVLRSKSTYEVKFEKAGYKPFVEYIGPSLDLKHDPILKIGPLEDAGFYNRLGPSPLEVELEHVLVPDIAGPDSSAPGPSKRDGHQHAKRERRPMRAIPRLPGEEDDPGAVHGYPRVDRTRRRAGRRCARSSPPS